MKKLAIAALAAVALAATASAEIRGHYVESRNAEIYASHCFANSEVGIKGDMAVMAWSIESGAFEGVDVSNLSVAAVIRASSTLGDPFGNPLPTRAVLIVDEKADAPQRAALEAFVKKSSNGLVDEIVNTESAPIALSFDGDLHAKTATLTAGDFIKVSTRPIQATDSLCHLDNIYYGPLVELDHAMPAFSKVTAFQVDGLGKKLTDHSRSSVYLGSFVVPDAQVSDD